MPQIILNDNHFMNKEMIENADKISADLVKEKPTIGKKMFYCRSVIQFSLEQMADFLETTAETLEKYEQDAEEPPLAFLHLYFFYFEVPMDAFVDEFIDMRQFMFNYDVFHFAKFFTYYKYVHMRE